MALAAVGRRAELATAAGFLDGIRQGSATLGLIGPAGIGKTTVLREIAAAGRRGSYVVLSTSPVEVEARLTYTGLGDLLDREDQEAGKLVERCLATLPTPQRRALEVALLRVDASGPDSDLRTTCLALLELLRRLADAAPVLLVIDDIHWLDASTARLLHFAARRLGPAPVRIVAAVRVTTGDCGRNSLPTTLPGGDIRLLSVGPLSAQALRRLVGKQLGIVLSRPAAGRLHAASAGNPLHALALAQETLVGEARPLFLEDDVRCLLEGRLAALPGPTRRAVATVAALARPERTLVEAAAGGSQAVELAFQAGVLLADGDFLRLAHPLLGSAVYNSFAGDQRRALHSRIAELVHAPEERARHLALAAAAPSESIALLLEGAAEQAAARGAPDAAAELAELAVRCTPVGDVVSEHRRTLTAATQFMQIGDRARARSLLEPFLVAGEPGPGLAAALRLAGQISYQENSMPDALSMLVRALAEAGSDRRLLARTGLELTYVQAQLGALTAAAEQARTALAHAEAASDDALVADALAVTAMLDHMLGRSVPAGQLEGALALEGPMHGSPVQFRPSLIAALIWMHTGRLGDARKSFERVWTDLTERGLEDELPSLLMGGGAVLAECWAGDLDRAADYADASLKAAAWLDHDVAQGLAHSGQALVLAYRGDAEGARRHATVGMSRLSVAGWPIAQMLPRAALGFLELSLGDPRAAHRALEPLLIVTKDFALNPSRAWFLPDEIEALVALGALERAELLTDDLMASGRRLGCVWTLATGARCQALAAAARGDLAVAHDLMSDALDHSERLGNPVEHGRTLLAAGRLHRRRRQKQLARDFVGEAFAVFTTVGAVAWAARCEEELRRVSPPAGTATSLSPLEQKVAQLVVTGLSNREVAAAAFLSVKTVEGVLTRIYRKVGVRSRVGLAQASAEPGWLARIGASARNSTPT